MEWLCIASLAAINSSYWNNIQVETAYKKSLEQLRAITTQRLPHLLSIHPY
jgi:hypothetical protein